MAVVSLVVAILAVIVAGVAAYFYFPAENRARKAERREEAAEQRARDAEQRAKAAELREQARVQREEAAAQREEAAARAARMGRPSTDLQGSEPGSGRAYNFRVTNIGQGVMRDLKPMLVDRDGNVVSEPLPFVYLNTLQSRERDTFTMKVKSSVARNPLFLRYEWTDDHGEQEHMSDVDVPDM